MRSTGTTYVPDENSQLNSRTRPPVKHWTLLLLVSYGIQSCTDGTSNTIAFAEALSGAPPFAPVRETASAALGATQTWGYLGTPAVTDAYGNVAQVMADLSGLQHGLAKCPDDL